MALYRSRVCNQGPIRKNGHIRWLNGENLIQRINSKVVGKPFKKRKGENSEMSNNKAWLLPLEQEIQREEEAYWSLNSGLSSRSRIREGEAVCGRWNHCGRCSRNTA